MGLFSFGGSTQDSRSFGQSSAFDVAGSGSVSGGVSEAGSRSTQQIAFEDIFARLFGGAESAAAGLDPSMLTEAANQLFAGGIDFLGTLAGGGPEREFLQARMEGTSPVLDDQIAALQEDVGRFFSEELLTGVTSDAVLAGGLGGGRQGVAQGIAAARAADAFSRGATELRAGDIAARDAAAAVLGDQRLQGAMAGLTQLPALAGIADLGFGAGLAPAERLAAILGSPTVLGESTSFSSAEDFARAFSQSFGGSQSTQESSSTSRALNLGFI